MKLGPEKMNNRVEWDSFHLEMAVTCEGWGLEDQPVTFRDVFVWFLFEKGGWKVSYRTRCCSQILQTCSTNVTLFKYLCFVFNPCFVRPSVDIYFLPWAVVKLSHLHWAPLGFPTWDAVRTARPTAVQKEIKCGGLAPKPARGSVLYGSSGVYRMSGLG